MRSVININEAKEYARLIANRIRLYLPIQTRIKGAMIYLFILIAYLYKLSYNTYERANLKNNLVLFD